MSATPKMLSVSEEEYILILFMNVFSHIFDICIMCHGGKQKKKKKEKKKETLNLLLPI